LPPSHAFSFRFKMPRLVRHEKVFVVRGIRNVDAYDGVVVGETTSYANAVSWSGASRRTTCFGCCPRLGSQDRGSLRLRTCTPLPDVARGHRGRRASVVACDQLRRVPLWRDLGYAVGALLAGVVADWLGMAAAIHVVAALTLLSGFVVLLRMRETLSSAR
jgi:hypothetical protein